VILAGPNGAGKTTFAREFLPMEAECPNYVNADLIAAGLAPFAPETAALAAGRLMLLEIERHVHARRSFAFETTLAGRAYVRSIVRWRSLGYRIELFFLRLPSVQFAIERVAQRVRQGGHSVPENVIARRFHSGLQNFETVYKPLVDAWTLIDTASMPFEVLDWSER
jgi:predicted ABC-type ATPase